VIAESRRKILPSRRKTGKKKKKKTRSDDDGDGANTSRVRYATT